MPKAKCWTGDLLKIVSGKLECECGDTMGKSSNAERRKGHILHCEQATDAQKKRAKDELAALERKRKRKRDEADAEDDDDDEEAAPAQGNEVTAANPVPGEEPPAPPTVIDADEPVLPSSNLTEPPRTQTSDLVPAPPLPKRQRQSLLHVSPATTATQQTRIDMAQARWWFSGNIPFNQTRNPFFKDFVRELRGTVRHIATDDMLRDSLLNAVYDEEVTPLIQQLEKEEYVVLHADAWLSRHNKDHVISFTATAPWRLNLETATMEEKSFTAAILLTYFQKVGSERTGVKWVAVVVDGGSNVWSAAKQWAEANGIVCILCVCHCANRFLNDTIGFRQKNKKPVKMPFTHVSEWVHAMISAIRNTESFRKTYLKKQVELNSTNKGLPHAPMDVRWLTTCTAFEDIAGNIEVLRAINDDPEEASLKRQYPQITRLFDDMGFFQEFRFTLKLLKPVNALILMLEGDEARLGQVIPCWWAMKKYFNTLTVPPTLQEKFDTVVESLDKRKTRYENCPVCLTAMILHPSLYIEQEVKEPSLLTPFLKLFDPAEYLNKAEKAVKTLGGEQAEQELVDFMTKEGKYQSTSMWANAKQKNVCDQK